MTSFNVFLFFAGVVFIGASVWRFTRRRLQSGQSYTDYVKEIKLKPAARDEFGRNVRWVINERRDTGQHPRGPKPPAETGR